MISLLILCATFAHISTLQWFPQLNKILPSEENYIVEDDPKDEFFKIIQNHRFNEKNYVEDNFEIPKPGGFSIYYNNGNKKFKRSVDYHIIPSQGLKSHFIQKRSDETDEDIQHQLKIAKEIKANVEKHLGKTLEVVLLEPENVTTETEETTTETPTTIPPTGDILVINDFIRFKRSIEDTDKSRSKRAHEDYDKFSQHINENSKDEDGAINDSRLSRERSEKMLLGPENVVQDGSREPRGATKEQWTKQPYPVQTNEENRYDDTFSSSSDNIRAPRVHFVTQRRSESIPPVIYRSYERESRARDLSRDISRDTLRDTDRDYYSSRPSRHYNTYPLPHHYQHRYEPHFHYEETRDRRYDPRYNDKYNTPERDRYTYSSNKQRRIIYYATLPDVVRTPPNVDLRDRYSYRDRYDDRYVTSPTVSIANSGSDRYRFRKPNYSLNKSRYEQEFDRNKSPLYPLKVSTDVNVREIKKNPERRIYSETDQRYAYKAPSYQNEEENYNRRQ